eukprot:3155416-Alexandrium_andersonii.AAC.1
MSSGSWPGIKAISRMLRARPAASRRWISDVLQMFSKAQSSASAKLLVTNPLRFPGGLPPPRTHLLLPGGGFRPLEPPPESAG